MLGEKKRALLLLMPPGKKLSRYSLVTLKIFFYKSWLKCLGAYMHLYVYKHLSTHSVTGCPNGCRL